MRAGTSALVVLAGLYAGSDVVAATQITASIGFTGLLFIDLPWLYRLHRLDRRALTRVPMTVRAVSAPSSGTLIVASTTMAWIMERGGLLSDAVVGDVIQADVNPKDGDPVVLTLGRERGMAPWAFPMDPERFRRLIREPLGNGDAAPDSVAS